MPRNQFILLRLIWKWETLTIKRVVSEAQFKNTFRVLLAFPPKYDSSVEHYQNVVSRLERKYQSLSTASVEVQTARSGSLCRTHYLRLEVLTVTSN
jgi:hypothetical protein